MTTPNYGFPYQLISDSPNGAALGFNGFTAVDSEILRVDTDIADVIARLNNASTAFAAGLVNTPSGAYVTLTGGPAVTLVTRSTAKVWWSAQAFNTVATNSARVGVLVSGASSVAASNARALIVTAGTAGNAFRPNQFTRFTGLTPGVNTFTLVYSAEGGSAQFADREITVEAP